MPESQLQKLGMASFGDRFNTTCPHLLLSSRWVLYGGSFLSHMRFFPGPSPYGSWHAVDPKQPKSMVYGLDVIDFKLCSSFYWNLMA